MSIVEKKSASTPATPPIGYVHWFVNAAGAPQFVDETGTLRNFTGQTGPTGPSGPAASFASALKFGTD